MKEREGKKRREKEELRGYDRDERIEDDCSTEVQRERKECKKQEYRNRKEPGKQK